MTLIYRFTLLFILSLGAIVAQDDYKSLHSDKVTTVYTLYVEKSDDNLYDDFKTLFSDYDGTLMEDMFIYTIDIFMPDEIIRTTKDIVSHRKDKGYNSNIEALPKILGNDILSVFLTTSYYYMQDISKITQRVWSDELCDPDTFVYDIDSEPQVALLDLKLTDENARGISTNGIVLPLNENFPHALYPFAKMPDGCSAEGFQDLYDQSNLLSDDDRWLTKACDVHDRCYSTIGKEFQECNSEFIVNIMDSCNHISGVETVLSLGSKNAFCGLKGLSIATGANACAEKYFSIAQRQQKVYFEWVKRYEAMYLSTKK